MLEQVKSLLALLREKHPPILLVIATVLSIVATVLSTIAAPGTRVVTVVSQRPLPPASAQKVAKLDLAPASCPVPAEAGACLQGAAPQPALAGLVHAASIRTIAGPKGPDVSAYQPNTNVAQVKAGGMRFIFAKATEGRSYVNPYFARVWRAARALHLPHGAYDFARPQPGWSGADEARHFHAVVKAAGGFDSLPPVLDVEASVLGRAATSSWVGQFVSEIRHLTGRHDVIVYTGGWFWNPRVGCNTYGTLLWVSGYANSIATPCGWAHPTFWQFTDGVYGPFPHSAPGVGRSDISVFQGHDLAALAQAGPTKAQLRLKAARRSHRIVHAKIHKRCRGRGVAHHSAGCGLLFRRNAQMHAKYGKALR